MELPFAWTRRSCLAAVAVIGTLVLATATDARPALDRPHPAHQRIEHRLAHAVYTQSDRRHAGNKRTKHGGLRGHHDFERSGIASIYSGGRTANGERVNPAAMTAAHRSLPFGTRVTVVNRNNGRAVVVRVNDRGPFVRGRVIDLTPAAARAIGIDGLAPVSLRVGASL
jgi:rare lipoprotein A